MAIPQKQKRLRKLTTAVHRVRLAVHDLVPLSAEACAWQSACLQQLPKYRESRAQPGARYIPDAYTCASSSSYFPARLDKIRHIGARESERFKEREILQITRGLQN